MTAATIIPAPPVPLFERAELPRNATVTGGHRAMHERGERAWWGPTRLTELDALRDAQAHEDRCGG